MQTSGLANGPEGRTGTVWDAIDWRRADRNVRNLRHRIFRATQAMTAYVVCDLLEPCEVKVSSTVLSQGSRGRHAFRNELETAALFRWIISSLFFSFVGGAR
jgi:hypothetical protein